MIPVALKSAASRWNTSDVVVAVSGHRRLAEPELPYLKAQIRRVFQRYTSAHPVALSCLAEGADQLFATTALELKWSLVAVLPCAGYEETFTSASAKRSLSNLMNKAERVVRLEEPAPTDAAYMRAGRFLVDQCTELVALWDGQPAQGTGGTADVVAYARQSDHRVTVIEVARPS